MRASGSRKPLPKVRALLGETDCRWYGIQAQHRDIVKQLPRRDRWWNPNLRAWVTPTYVVASLPQLLEDVGYEVVVIDVSRVIEPRNWHQVYAERFGHPCPHRRKSKTAAQPPAVNLDHLEAAA